MRSAYILAGILTAIGGCSQFPIYRQMASPPEICSTDSAGPAPVGEPLLQGKHPIDFYVQLALQRNPEILAKEQAVAARAQVVPQVTSLPDPMLTNTVYPIPDASIQTAAGRIANSLTLSQRFPWFGKLQLRGEIADLETKIAFTRLAETQLKVIEAVKLSCYDIHLNQEIIEITKESEKLLEKLFIPFAEARYRTGKSSQQDVLRAQVELIKIRNQLIQLRRQLALSQADLAKQLAAGPATDMQVVKMSKPAPLPEQFDHLYQAAVASRPELQGKLQAIFRDERKIGLAEREYYPDVTVGISWNAITRSDALAGSANGNDSVGLLLSINLPVWHNKLRAGVLEAKHRTAESSRLYQATRDETFRQIRRLTVQAKTFDEQIELFEKKLIPTSEQTLTISFQDYRVGKTDALQVIDNWLLVLRFRTQLARLHAARGQTLASLERVVGLQLTPEKAFSE